MVHVRGADLRGAGAALSAEPPAGSTFVIFNPASGRGRGGRRIGAYQDLIRTHLPHAEFGVSEYAGHEYELADRALQRGVKRLVAVGGDGTWSHVADRVVSSGRTDVQLGLLPSGTGNDFGRNLDLSFSDPADAVARLVRGRPVPVDIGRVHTPSRAVLREGAEAAEPRPRHFLNVVGVGFDVAVLEATAGARFLKGEALYKVTALQQLFRFGGLRVGVSPDGTPLPPGDRLMVTVTNGAYFGGGFPITPSAQIDDGRLHACVIGNARPLRRLKLFNRAERGRHVGQPEVELGASPRYTLTFEAPIRFEVDGDLFATESRELALEVLPGALQVIRE